MRFVSNVRILVVSEMFVRSFSKVPPWTHDSPWPYFTVVDFALWTVSTSLRISSFQKKIKENKTSCSALARSHANSWHFTAINENRFYIRQQLFYIYIYICIYKITQILISFCPFSSCWPFLSSLSYQPFCPVSSHFCLSHSYPLFHLPLLHHLPLIFDLPGSSWLL